MQVNSSLLSYCTNIHSGESWLEHFNAIKQNFPSIKNKLSPDHKMGIGLRLSNIASLELIKPENIQEFKSWLSKEKAFVFTMNGFPYGSFHNTRVKDHVHSPDWTTNERVEYTSRLFDILSEILPEGMEGGISTSPLSYRYWYNDTSKQDEVKKASTKNILLVVEHLIKINQRTSQVLHLDIEPEPDGMLETGSEFIEWFETYLLPNGISYITNKFNVTVKEAEELLKKHVCICYDVCHFAIGYEPHEKIISELTKKGITIGKIQISSALKAEMTDNREDREQLLNAFSEFNESTYLHQVVALKKDNTFIRYRDLPDALVEIKNAEVKEWRSHFHVPVFLKDYGILKSTQDDIITVLGIHNAKPITNHLEVETYTWEVLPENLKVSLNDCIVRELAWVQKQLIPIPCVSVT